MPKRTFTVKRNITIEGDQPKKPRRIPLSERLGQQLDEKMGSAGFVTCVLIVLLIALCLLGTLLGSR